MLKPTDWSATPEIVESKAEGNNVYLHWKSINGATAYVVYEIVDGKYKSLGAGTDTKNERTINNVSDGTHVYAVRGRAKNGSAWTYTSYSNEVSVTVGEITPVLSWNDKPVLTSVTAEGNSVTASWMEIETATAYVLYELVDGKYVSTGAVDTLEKTFTVEDGVHSYVVRGRKKVDGSNKYTDYSDPIEVTVGNPNIIRLNDVVYEIVDGALTIVKYEGSSDSVTIPETVNGYTVTIVGEGAFENNTALVSIDLPDTITIIKKRAFANCTSLANMN